MPSRNFARPDQARCVSCGACTKVCPRDAIHIWKGCCAVVDPDRCVGCRKCAKICPADCILIQERGLVHENQDNKVV